MKKISYLLLLIFLISCGHGTLEFQSYPNKAEVSISDSDGEIRRLGETPINLDTDRVFLNRENAVKVIFTKKGHKDEVVYLTKPAVKSEVKISARLQEINNAKEVLSNQKIEKISSLIAQAQQYSFAKNFNKAESVLLSMVEEYPGISVPYDLLANIYYLTNNKNKALHYYEIAREISPRNSERDYIIKKIRNEDRMRGDTTL